MMMTVEEAIKIRKEIIAERDALYLLYYEEERRRMDAARLAAGKKRHEWVYSDPYKAAKEALRPWAEAELARQDSHRSEEFEAASAVIADAERAKRADYPQGSSFRSRSDKMADRDADDESWWPYSY